MISLICGILNKLIKTELRLIVAKDGGGRQGNWVNVVTRYKLPVMREISSRECHMSTIVNCTIFGSC